MEDFAEDVGIFLSSPVPQIFRLGAQRIGDELIFRRGGDILITRSDWLHESGDGFLSGRRAELGKIETGGWIGGVNSLHLPDHHDVTDPRC